MEPINRPGRGRQPITHGGYTLYSRAKLPSTRTKVRKYLKAARKGLLEELGEENLTPSREILLDRIITLLGIVRSQEELAREGVTRGVKLPANHLSYCSQISRDLKALGINGQKPKPPSRQELEGLLDTDS